MAATVLTAVPVLVEAKPRTGFMGVMVVDMPRRIELCVPPAAAWRFATIELYVAI